MKREVDLILDSGAYSAWKRQEDLTVEEYIKFLLENKDFVSNYVNMDVIPGRWGMIPTAAMVEASAQKGWDNAEKMRAAGLEPMPVFHQGERLYWLDRMLDSGYEYIGISPANDRTTGQKREWLDEVFQHMCGSKGYPEVKTHGFGVTALPLLFRYPWYSADSVTWLLVGGYGAILIPRKKGSAFDYAVPPSILQISEREKKGLPAKSALQPGRHIKTLGPNERQYVLDYCEAEGFDIEKLRDDYLYRQRINCRFFKKAAESYMPPPFRHKKLSLFSRPESTRGQETNPWGHLKMVFTLTTHPEQSDILQDEGVRHRLLTYYYIFRGETIDLDSYTRTGRLVKKKKKKRKLAKVKA